MFFLCLVTIKAQVPAGFNYQAVVRNSSGDYSGTDAAFSINQSGTGNAIYVYNPNTTAEITCIYLPMLWVLVFVVIPRRFKKQKFIRISKKKLHLNE